MYYMLQVLKIIFIVFLSIFVLSRIAYGVSNTNTTAKARLVNLIEIAVSSILTFAIYKF